MMMRSLFNPHTIALVFILGFGLGFLGPTIEERLQTLDKKINACCETLYPPTEAEEANFRDYVALKSRIQHLEREVEELKAVMGLRK